MDTFQELIASHEEWLVNRTLHYARRHGYTRYSSTLLEAWRQSVTGLSSALILAKDDPSCWQAPDADMDYTADPMTAFGVEQARRHRSRGTDLTMFLALLKYYRQSYLDLMADHVPAPVAFGEHRDFILKMFDKIELGCISEWRKPSLSEELDTLQSENKDITEQKLIYLTIFETLKDPVIFADETGSIKNMNRSACLHFTPYGTPGAVYYGKTDTSAAEKLFSPYLDFPSQEADFPDCRLPTGSGLRRFHIKARRMIDSSERMAGIVLICTDITDYRRALQDAARADRAKSAFLATMSHELRTPAAGILGASELLGQTDLAPNQQQYLDLIEASGSTLLGILDELLDYSKFEEVGVTVAMEDFDLTDIIENTVKVMRYQALSKAITLDVSIAGDIPARLNGDADKLSRILMNLIGNAVKFTERGSISLSVQDIGRRKHGGLLLEFSVSDTGIGFAPEKMEQIFKPFTQGDDSISRKFGGTGLGLAICKRIVEALGGEIGAESQGSRGSTFWFRLPFREAMTPKLPQPAPTETDAGPLTVLMVEDNDVNQIIGVELLKHLGHTVDLAEDGDRALSMLQNRDYDVILLDIHLPGMDGYAVAESVRSLKIPRKARVPLIALTADDSAEARRRTFSAGMNGFLMKPFRSADLQRALSGLGLPPPLIDLNVLRSHEQELGRKTVSAIVSAFRSSTRTIGQELATASATDDTGTIIFSIHKLKGAASNLGLAQLIHSAEHLEKNFPSMSLKDRKDGIGQLLNCLEASLTALDASLRDIAGTGP